MTWKLGADDPDIAVDVLDRYDAANAVTEPEEPPAKRPRSLLLYLLTFLFLLMGGVLACGYFGHLLWRIAVYGWNL